MTPVASSLAQPRAYSFKESPKVIVAWFGDPSASVLPVAADLAELVGDAEVWLGEAGVGPIFDDVDVPIAEPFVPESPPRTSGFGSSLSPIGHQTDGDVSASITSWDSLWAGVMPPATWATIRSLEPRITRWPVFTDTPETLARLVVRGEMIDAEYRSVGPSPSIARLARYIAFVLDEGTEVFAMLHCLQGLDGVGYAYIASGVEVALPTAKGTYTIGAAEIGQLSHLGIDGVDAEPPSAAPITVPFADVEYDWNTSHEAFGSQPPSLRTAKGWSTAEGDWVADRSNRTTPSFSPKDYWSHGTAAVGTAVGHKGRYRGIAPKAETFLSPVIPPTPPGRYAQIFAPIGAAIGHAVAELCLDQFGPRVRGGVLLVELQTQRDGLGPYRPCEFEPAIWDAIRVACSNGITVIEPAGNGGINLATAVGGAAPGFHGWPNDSNALMVGAAIPRTRVRWLKSAYGPRVDCFGWSGKVVASACDDLAPVQDPPAPEPTPRDNTGYYDDFSGTSAASAMIAGAAIVVQQFAKTNLGGQLPPRLLRALLSSPSLGVEAVFGHRPGQVGVMPSLRALRELSPNRLLEALGDAWIRTPHMNPSTLPAATKHDQVAQVAWNAYGQP